MLAAPQQFYGLAISFFNGVVSVATLKANSENTIPKIDETNTWKTQKSETINIETLKKVLATVAEVTELQIQENNRTNNHKYHLPILFAWPGDQSVSSELTQEPVLTQDMKDCDLTTIGDTIKSLILRVCVQIKYPIERLALYKGLFLKGSQYQQSSNRYNSTNKRSIDNKISYWGPKALTGSTTAKMRLARIAKLDQRRSLKESTFHKRAMRAHFENFYRPFDRFLDIPEVHQAIRKEFKRQGYNGKVILSFPGTKKNPYFSDLLAPEMMKLVHQAI